MKISIGSIFSADGTREIPYKTLVKASKNKGLPIAVILGKAKKL